MFYRSSIYANILSVRAHAVILNVVEESLMRTVEDACPYNKGA